MSTVWRIRFSSHWVEKRHRECAKLRRTVDNSTRGAAAVTTEKLRHRVRTGSRNLESPHTTANRMPQKLKLPLEEKRIEK